MSKKKYVPLSREPPEKLKPKEFLRAEIWMKKIAIIFLLSAYAGVLICTFLIYFFQGFQWHGFNLERSLLRWLGAVTIGEIAGLAALVYGSLFRRK